MEPVTVAPPTTVAGFSASVKSGINVMFEVNEVRLKVAVKVIG
jgi:hypothetical protein